MIGRGDSRGRVCRLSLPGVLELAFVGDPPALVMPALPVYDQGSNLVFGHRYYTAGYGVRNSAQSGQGSLQGGCLISRPSVPGQVLDDAVASLLSTRQGVGVDGEVAER